MRRLAAEAMLAMGAKAVQTCQVYLARALGDADETVKDTAKRALAMAGCDGALKGSMALYDKTSCPCGLLTCAMCKHVKVPALLDEEALSEERSLAADDEEAGLSDFGASADSSKDASRRPSSCGRTAPAAAPMEAEAPGPASATEGTTTGPETFKSESLRQTNATEGTTTEPETFQSESPRQTNMDPWGPQGQASRNGSKKRAFPNLEIDTGRAPSKLEATPLPPPSSSPPED